MLRSNLQIDGVSLEEVKSHVYLNQKVSMLCNLLLDITWYRGHDIGSSIPVASSQSDRYHP